MPASPDFERYAETTPYGDAFVQLPRLLLENIQKGRGAYLELGAGDGQKLQLMMRLGLLKSYSSIQASDISAKRVARLNELPGVNAFEGDAQTGLVPPGSVDFIFSDQVIEHVPDDRAMAAAIREALKPGGICVIGSVVKQPGAWYFYRNGGQWRLDPTHVREYASVQAFGEVFKSVGLQVLELDSEPVAYPIVELIARAATRFTGSRGNTFREFYTAYPWARRMSIKVPIPRYRLCYVLAGRTS